MNFLQSEVAAQCVQQKALLTGLVAPIDPAQLIWALSLNESTGGEDCTPRHEPAYDVGGIYSHAPSQQALLAKYGRAAACSYGPLQILLANCPAASPKDFDDLETAMRISVTFLNNQIRRFKPTTVAQIGSIWNAGHITTEPSPGVIRYCTDLVTNYQRRMPL